MELSKYLRFLLYNNDTVVIPGIGALVTYYHHAEINTSEKTISPPSKFLGFDAKKVITDNLLLNYISESKNISRAAAEAELNEILSGFVKRLDNGETVLLDGIGYFSKDDGNVRFEKEQDHNFLTDSFGLSRIDLVSLEEPEPTATIPVYEPVRQKRYTIFLVIPILLLLIGGGIFVYLNYPDISNFSLPKKDKHVVAPVTADTTANKQEPDTSKKQVIEEYYDSTTEKKNALALPKQDSVKLKYSIIAGSFKTIEKAKELSKIIESDGYKTKIIHSQVDIYRISLGEYFDLKTANEELDRIRKSKGDNTVWILKEKLDK